MLVKIITFFLIFMAVLALFGRLRFPGGRRAGLRRCPDCGAPLAGRAGCPCRARRRG